MSTHVPGFGQIAPPLPTPRWHIAMRPPGSQGPQGSPASTQRRNDPSPDAAGGRVDDVVVLGVGRSKRWSSVDTPVHSSQQFVCRVAGFSTHRRPAPQSRSHRHDVATHVSGCVQIAVSSWDRPRLLEDVARTFAEHGANIVSYGGTVEDQMAKNWYVAEVGDVKSLRTLLTALRNVDAVFDAFRVTPS